MAQLVAWVGRRTVAPGPFPDPAPAPGQSRHDWLAAVSAARARHDAAALAAGALAVETLPPPPDSWAAVDATWVSLAADTTMRVYTPDGPGPFPAVLLIHGGAFWMGGGAAGFHLNDALCRQIAAETGAVAFNFDHRLAPEYPYPIPLEDISQALDWIVGRAAELKVDADRLALFGISSGANLVCAAGQRAASRGSPVLAGQVLQCPSLDLSPTSARFAGRLTDAANANLIAGAETIASYYAAGTDRHNPGVSPGLCPDLVGTPATLVVVAEYDHLADDGLSFARRLTSAGVPVTTRTYPMTHTIALPSVFRRMHHETMAWLRGVFND